jgi:acyl-CoA synthetase (AMP-forming)/AMP-acid ligase II
LAAANDWQVTQAFASPAVWRKLSAHCGNTGQRIESLRQIFSCGAPVPANVLRQTLLCAAPDAKMQTPYGATECLPVATIEAAEVLGETAARTDEGAGVCVGRKFDSIEWRVIRITDEPITRIDAAEVLPNGEIGELIVRGSQVSPRYVTRTECNADAKIVDGDSIWHRMGDVGYLDEQGRFWYCGRKSQRVETSNGPLFTECVEAVFGTHRLLRRCALVSVGSKGHQTPVVIYEPHLPRTIDPGSPESPLMSEQLAALIPGDLAVIGAKHSHTADIQQFLRHNRFPVDIRHNSKINREQLASWAAEQLSERK